MLSFVRVSIDKICGVVQEAAMNYYNHDAVIGAITMKHIKSGGGHYDDKKPLRAVVSD